MVNNIISNNKYKKNYKSASLIFYDETLGYLLCEEFRYKKKLIHPIGGKVEIYDKNLLETSIREFIEETNLEVHEKFNPDKNNKEELIKKIIILIDKKYKYFDICINNELNHYHRYFYVKLINNIANEFIDIIKNLPDFFNNKYKTEVENLYWINTKNINKNFSWLLKKFLYINLKK
jgi:hypothetical protein